MREWKIAPLIPLSAPGASVYICRKKNTPGWGSKMDNNGDTDFYCREVSQFESAWLCIRVITCNEVSYLESAWLCVRLLACRVEVRYTQTIHLATPSRSVFLSKHMN